jgi:pimeloyl-ACP methyl ester carboxylesterase
MALSRPTRAMAPRPPATAARTMPGAPRALAPTQAARNGSGPGFAGIAAALLALLLQACADPPSGGHGRPAPSAAADRPVAAAADARTDLGAGQQLYEERFVEVDRVALRHIERGAGGPPVVLLHGDGSMVEDFATSGVLDLAAERHRVVAFDRPGFGRSERPRDREWTPQAQAALLAGAFARLGIERPIVVGHSWGTLVALALALDRPEAVSGLVLVSGYYYPVPRPDAALAALPAVPVLGDALRYTVAPVAGALLAPGLTAAAFHPAPVPPRFAAGFPVARTLRPGHIRAGAEDSGLLTPSAAALERRYGELRPPVAIVVGAEDRIVDPGLHSLRLHRELPGSGLWVVAGEGHMVHHGAAGVVADAVEAVSTAAR